MKNILAQRRCQEVRGSQSLYLTILFLLLSSISFAQSGEGMGPNTANNWNFARNTGLDFNSGYPVAVTSAYNSYGGSTISDTLGQLLFYVTGDGLVFNRNHMLMENGDLINSGAFEVIQNTLIIPVPGSSVKYYIFTVGHEYDPIGMYYHMVDMSQNGGLGSVVVKDVKLDAAIWAHSRLNAVRHSNKTDFWVIARIVFDSRYVAFHVSESGVDPVPVVSPARYSDAIDIRHGEMKISPDSKTLVSLEWHYNTVLEHLITISDIDASNGIISERFAVETDIELNSDLAQAAEFSPDSKFLYVGFESNETPFGALLDNIWQFDMTMTDSLSFSESRTHIKTLNNKWFRDIQLAQDGKIYIVQSANITAGLDSLDVINKPWEKGTACDYVANIMGLQTTYTGSTYEPLPNFIQEQLFRFVYNGSCAKGPFTFRHRFIPEPDSIVWDFGDGTSSTVFNPVHVFQSGGIYEVHAHVVYPDGRIEETSRKVEVLAAPEPWLGNDTLMCSNETIQLDAGSGFTQYVWNGQFPPGNQFYTAVDTGYYSVRVRNDLNCYGSDTIHIGKHREVFFDDSNLQISQTTCGNSTGAIRGLQVSDGATVEWHNSGGILIGTEIDLTGVPAGNYILTITDTTGCTRELPAYAINNIDVNLIIENVDSRNASCGEANGMITVHTISSVSADLLEYSITSGTWENNAGAFTNITPGTYFVVVRDADGCEALYDNNPVVITDNGGPEVVSTSFTPATGSGSNGSLTVTATGDSLIYTLNTGASQDTGYFTGLTAGMYTVIVNDKYGCDTTVVIIVTSETGYQLSALAGGDRKCLHKIATSVLKVSNLFGVKDFKTTVLFNNLLMDCIGYDQQFDAALSVTEFPGRAELEWHGNMPLTLTDTVTLVHLVFETTQTGTADVRWDLTTDSYFRDENGLDIPCIPIDGEVLISEPPVVLTNGDRRLCEGAFTVISGDAFKGTPPYSIEWTKPDGSTSSESPIWLFNIGVAHAGEYIVKVSDRYCTVSDTVNLEVIPPPSAGFPEEPITFENQYTLEAPQGYAFYEWSTGDTTYSITVTEEGEYSVIIKTTEGCESRDTAMLVNVTVPVYVPNAYTPNGDGLNDTFKPIITKSDLVTQYHLSIYNRWGQCFFETSDPAKVWDGRDELPGVYSWVVSYMDGMGRINQLRGVVTLIR